MISFVIVTLCSFVTIGIGIYAIHREQPMWFYAGDEDEIENVQFHNVKEFNRKSGIMWITYGLSFYIPSILQFLFSFHKMIYMMILVAILVFGMIAMMVYWNCLYDRYTKT